MCEFCREHGEGKKWYLQMNNYSRELFLQAISPEQQRVVGAPSRQAWNEDFLEWFVGRALRGEPRPAPAATETGTPQQPRSPEVRFADQKVTHFGQVVPLEDAEMILDMADSITRFPCGCRYWLTGKSDKRYCFGLGVDIGRILGRFPDPASSLEVLSSEEARKIVRGFDNEGLMHSVWTGVTPYTMGLCNCDHDCGAYRRYVEEDGTPNFFHAEYVCQVDWDRCTGCKSCMKQCQFGAAFWSSASAKAFINPRKCFGCGVCRAACARGAISLLPRETVPEAADIWTRPLPR